jgi:hypothetical protein
VEQRAAAEDVVVAVARQPRGQRQSRHAHELRIAIDRRLVLDAATVGDDADGDAGQRPEPAQLHHRVANLCCVRWPGLREASHPRMAHQLHQDVDVNPQRLQVGYGPGPDLGGRRVGAPRLVPGDRLHPLLHPIDPGIVDECRKRSRLGLRAHLRRGGGEEEDAQGKRQKSHDTWPSGGRIMLTRFEKSGAGLSAPRSRP